MGPFLALVARWGPPAHGQEPTSILPLQTSFLLVREDIKAAVLLYLLRNVIRPQDQTVVFVATKHHAEYLTEVSRELWDGETPWALSNQPHPWSRAALPRETTRGQQRSGHEPGWGFFTH